LELLSAELGRPPFEQVGNFGGFFTIVVTLRIDYLLVLGGIQTLTSS